mmetsp:Transcript_738/g.1764  ORF Transcript_738/g.1764 Transcript_738/m.1764 type:complete len:293 (-) Transcript_738:403-1281(-)
MLLACGNLLVDFVRIFFVRRCSILILLSCSGRRIIWDFRVVIVFINQLQVFFFFLPPHGVVDARAGTSGNQHEEEEDFAPVGLGLRPLHLPAVDVVAAGLVGTESVDFGYGVPVVMRREVGRLASVVGAAVQAVAKVSQFVLLPFGLVVVVVPFGACDAVGGDHAALFRIGKRPAARDVFEGAAGPLGAGVVVVDADGDVDLIVAAHGAQVPVPVVLLAILVLRFVHSALGVILQREVVIAAVAVHVVLLVLQVRLEEGGKADGVVRRIGAVASAGFVGRATVGRAQAEDHQ